MYVVGPGDPTFEGRLMAALLATGPESAASHRCAAVLWGFVEGDARIEVSAPRSRGHLPGLRVHRPRRLGEPDVTELRGLRVTSVARTLVDLCAVLTSAHIARACHEAQVMRLVTQADLLDVIDRSQGRRGVGKLRRLVGVPVQPTRSQLERRCLAMIAEAGLPEPRVNASARALTRDFEVDAQWPELRLIAEFDGWSTHRTRQRFESDRARDSELVAAGWRVMRFTAARVKADRPGVIRDLRAAHAVWAEKYAI